MDQTEKAYLEKVLDLTKGKIEETCRISGLSRTPLYARLRKHGLRGLT
ncbi:MAG: helix-turn-helix domain-containing protein [Desulfobacteraceae bacterium]